MKEMEEEEYGDINPQFHAKEKEMEQKMDELAKKANVIFQTRQGGTGDEPIVWAKVLEVVLWIYLVLTIKHNPTRLHEFDLHRHRLVVGW